MDEIEFGAHSLVRSSPQALTQFALGRLASRGLDIAQRLSSRQLRFPTDRSSGTIWRSQGQGWGRRLGSTVPAQGVFRAEPGDFVTFRCSDASSLDHLDPFDVDGLLLDQLHPSDVRRIARMVGLRQLSVERALIADQDLIQLRGLTRLTELRLSGSFLTGAGLSALECLDLTEIGLRGAPLTDRGVSAISRFDALRSLSLEETSTGDHDIEGLTRLEQLSSLDLDSTPISDLGIKTLDAFRSLRMLSLAGTGATDDGLRHLSGLLNLKFLDLQHTRIAGHGFTGLTGLKTLKQLALDSTDISDDGIRALDGMASLDELWLSDTAITDQSLVTPGILHRVSALSLSGCAVTDEGLLAFAKIGAPALHHLDVSRTSITKRGILVLKQLSALKVVFVSNSIDPVDRLQLERSMPGIELGVLPDS